MMKLKENRTYYSKTLGTRIHLYKQPIIQECNCCGKVGKNHWNFTRDDDEEQLEYTYGNECIKKLELEE